MKGTDIGTIDVETQQKVWLYSPREQNWAHEFEITPEGFVIGKTAEGRATARLLGMNDLDFPKLRRVLRKTGRW
jgi:hypothetical protein